MATATRRGFAIRELLVTGALGLTGWAVGAAAMWLTFWAASVRTGFAVRSIVVVVLFHLVSMEYFRRRSALGPLFVALMFAGIEVMADGAVALEVGTRLYDIPRSVLGTWLPAALVLLVTWVTGIGISQRTPRDEAAKELT